MYLYFRIFSETLRHHPLIPVIFRLCKDTFNIPNSNYSIPANTIVLIPAEAIQKDERYYKNSQYFNPSNFNEDCIKEQHSMTNLLFGAGPRHCSGTKLTRCLLKISLTILLSNFIFDVTEKTPSYIHYKNDNLMQNLTQNINLNIKYEPLMM